MERKNYFAIFIELVAWFSVITQYVLMLENRTASYAETTVRFFSYFTILTNTLVAIYFSKISLLENKNPNITKQAGIITAITVYITIVGLVYQIVLRPLWKPTGLQQLVDELLHSVNPVLVILFWVFFVNTKSVAYKEILKWLVYPMLYLFYILIRGSFSNFYPYPFVNVSTLGMPQVIRNAFGLLLFFSMVSLLFLFLGKKISFKK